MLATTKFSVCQVSYPDSSFEEDLSVLVDLGIPGISIAEGKLRQGEEERQLEAFQASGLTASASMIGTGGILPSFPATVRPGPEDPQERIELMKQGIRRVAPFKPTSIVLTTGSARGRTLDEARALVVEGLRAGAETAGEFGLRVSLEPMRDVGWDGSFIRTLPEAVELIDEAGADNLDLCYDVYHLWDTPNIRPLTEQYAARIGSVHVCDWRDPPRAMADRLMPGDGTIDVTAIIESLRRGGYDGWYDLEVFSDDGRWGTELPDSLWRLPPNEFYGQGRDGFERVWAGESE